MHSMFRLALLVCVLSCPTAAAQPVPPSPPPYTIRTLKMRLTIERDGALLVEEGIEVAVRENRQGFDWRVPLTDADGRPLTVEILDVKASHLWTDTGGGPPIPYTVVRRGPWAELSIADPGVYHLESANGTAYCRVAYRVRGAIRRGTDEDQLRWIVGKWQAPITDDAEVWVQPPPGVQSRDLRWFLERDYPGRDARPYRIVDESNFGSPVRRCVRINQPVPADGFVVLRLRWTPEPGTPDPLAPSARRAVRAWAPLWLALFLPFALLALWAQRRWRLGGRLVRARDSEPGPAPAVVCAVALRGDVDARGLAAATLDLADRGQLGLTATEDGDLLVTRGAPGASPAEQALIDALCPGGACALSTAGRRLTQARPGPTLRRELAEQGWLGWYTPPRGAAWSIPLIQGGATFLMVGNLTVAPAPAAVRLLTLTGAVAALAAIAALGARGVLRLALTLVGLLALASLGAQTEPLQLRATLPLAPLFALGGALAAALVHLVEARPAYEWCGPRGGASLARAIRWRDALDDGDADGAPPTMAAAVALDRLPAWLAIARAADRKPTARGVSLSAAGPGPAAQLRAVEAALIDRFTTLDA